MPKENQLKGRKTCGILTSVALTHGHLTLLLLLSMERQDITGNVWWDQVPHFMVCRRQRKRQRERQREGDRKGAGTEVSDMPLCPASSREESPLQAEAINGPINGWD